MKDETPNNQFLETTALCINGDDLSFHKVPKEVAEELHRRTRKAMDFWRKLRSREHFIRRLATEGGSIVSSAECSPAEIADAQANGRMLVLDDGLGFVRRLSAPAQAEGERSAPCTQEP